MSEKAEFIKAYILAAVHGAGASEDFIDEQIEAAQHAWKKIVAATKDD